MQHDCLTCRPGPYRVVDHERGIISVPRGFRGPPSSMHGGAAAGMVVCLGDANLAGPTARLGLRLHAPPPLTTELPLLIQLGDDGERLEFTVTDPDGDRPILTGWAATANGAPDEPTLAPDDLRRLAAHADPNRAQRDRHDAFVDVEDNADFLGCFGCGPDNEIGLGLRTKPVSDGIGWAEWQPAELWSERDGVAMIAAVAALDCTSAFPLKQFGITALDDTALLGSYEAEIFRRPPVSPHRSYRIVTSPHERNGRKILADIGLFDPEGQVYIVGRATWIVLSRPSTH